MKQRHNGRIVLGLTMMMGLAVTLAPAAMHRGHPCWTTISDPASENAIAGTVEEVTERAGRRKCCTGIHLILVTEEETLEVHLGPATFLAEHEFSFAPGDWIEVTGWRVTREGTDSLIARVVNAHDRVLTLRDSEGTPAWSGGRGGRWR